MTSKHNTVRNVKKKIRMIFRNCLYLQAKKHNPMGNTQNNIIIYNTDDGKAKVVLYALDGNVWMNQNQMAELFDTSKQSISYHIVNILNERELHKNSVVKEFLTTAPDGKEYNVTFYSLDMILAVGFRVRSKRGIQFRRWANQNLKEYMIKGFVIDDERLKNPDGRPDYFDELLERIKDIRSSEKRFYQKVKDLLVLSSDYDADDKATQMFFAIIQNKLLYAVTGLTAAEIVFYRADISKPNMNLTSWKGKVVRKQDVTIAKNYLTKDEIESLNNLTVLFLDSAEERVKNRKDLTLDYWEKNVDLLLQFQDKKVLQKAGTISNAKMEKIVKAKYDEFNQRRKLYEAKQEDKKEEEDLKLLEQKIKSRK